MTCIRISEIILATDDTIPNGKLLKFCLSQTVSITNTYQTMWTRLRILRNLKHSSVQYLNTVMTNKRTAMRVLTTITIEIMILQWKHLARYNYQVKIIKIPNSINLLKRVEWIFCLYWSTVKRAVSGHTMWHTYEYMIRKYERRSAHANAFYFSEFQCRWYK